MNNLSAVIYRSRALTLQSDLDLFHLLSQARDRNARLELSGMIVYDRGFFFQWLEGNDAQLGDVWNSIRRDSRHHDVLVLADQRIPDRLFQNWHMRFAHRNVQHACTVNGFAVAHPALLDDLHLNADKIPNILATFSTLGDNARQGVDKAKIAT